MSVAITLAMEDRVSKTLDRIIRCMDKLEGKVDKVEKEFSNVGKGASEAVRGVNKLASAQDKTLGSAKRLGDAWGKIGTAVSAAIGYFSVSAISGLVQKGFAQANSMASSETQLAKVMANTGGSYEGFEAVKAQAMELEKTTTVGADAILGGMGELSTYISDPQVLMSLMPTMLDYSVGMGGVDVDKKQVVEYATQLGKVFTGAYDGISRNGFEVSEAQKEILKTGSDMEKAAVINKVIAESWGGLAVAMADTPEGKMASLNKIFDGMLGTFANQLAPTMMSFFDTLAGGVDIGNGALGQLADVLNTFFMVMTDLLNVAVEVFHSIGGFETLTPLILGIVGAVALLAIGFAIASIAASPLITPFLLLVPLIALIVYKVREWAREMGGMQNAWAQVKLWAQEYIDKFSFGLQKLMTQAQKLKEILCLNWGALGELDKKMKNIEAREKEAKALRDKERSKIITKQEQARLDADRGASAGIDPNKKYFDNKKVTVDGSLDKVDEVGKVNSDVNIAKEDLVLLRDVAEARFVQNFVTMTPNVSMHVDTVNNRGDEQDLFNRFTNEIKNQLSGSVKGVVA